VRHNKWVMVFCLYLVACASPPQRVITSSPKVSVMTPQPQGMLIPLPSSLSSQGGVSIAALTTTKMTPTIENLLKRALAQYEQNELGMAGTTVERALRIAPRDPILWYFLARIRYVQKNTEQAIQLAMRANSFAKGNAYLTALNWRTVADARSVQGDQVGAQQALSQVQFYEKKR